MLSGFYRTGASAEFVVTTLQVGKHLAMNCRTRRGIYALLIPLNSVGTCLYLLFVLILLVPFGLLLIHALSFSASLHVLMLCWPHLKRSSLSVGAWLFLRDHAAFPCGGQEPGQVLKIAAPRVN